MNMVNAADAKPRILLHAIGDYISETYQYKHGYAKISLYNGDAGILLLQTLFYMCTGREQFRAAMEKNLDGIINVVQSPPAGRVSPTFSNGLAGLGWLFHYLNEIDVVDLPQDNFYKPIDAYLSQCLDELLWVKNFDLMHGATGIAMYFLKRGNCLEVEKVINALYENCERSGDEIMWSYYSSVYNQQIYNLGLAHGMAGAMYFLKKCADSSCSTNKCSEMIQGCYRFFINNMQDHDKAGFFYPDLIFYKDYQNKNIHHERSRLAWCHGDAGIVQVLYSLHSAGYINASPDLMQFMITQTAARNDLDSSLIEDPNFCHGSSGTGTIFHDLFRKTGNDLLRQASETWRFQTIALVDQYYNTSMKYDFCVDGVDLLLQKDGTGLLDGITGIGLFLLSQEMEQSFEVFDREQRWKECVFLC